MSRIDELVRDFRRDLSDAPAGAAGRVVARLREEPTPRERLVRRGLRRQWLLTAVGTAGAIGLAVVLGIVFLASPKYGATGDRGEWGLEATVRVTPSGGSLGLDELTERAVSAFNGRADAKELVGVSATAIEPGLLRVQAPQAVRAAQLEPLLEFADVRIYDAAKALLETTDPREAARWLRTHAVQGEAPGAWTLLPKRVQTVPAIVAFPSREELERMTGERILRDHEIVAIPAGLLVLATARLGPRQITSVGGSYLILRNDPVVRAEEVTGARDSRDRTQRVELQLTHAASDRLQSLPAGGSADLVAVRVGRNGVSLLGDVVVGQPRASGRTVDVVQRTGSRIDFGPESFGAALAGGGGLQARLTIESVEAYGTPPALAGEKPAALPAEIVRSLDQPSSATVEVPQDPATDKVVPVPRDAVLRALAGSRGNDTWELFVARTSWGADVSWIARDRSQDPRADRVDPRAASRNEGQAIACDVAPGRPVLTVCLNLQDQSGRFIFHMLGRSAPQVARVEVRYRSRGPDAAVVANGWWLASVPGDRPAPTEFVALDAQDHVLASVPPDQ